MLNFNKGSSAWKLLIINYLHGLAVTACNNLHTWGSSSPPLSLSTGSYKQTIGNF